MGSNIYAKVNRVSWLLAVIDEELRHVDKVSGPIYARLDVVLSSEFCLVENDWKKLKTLHQAATGKYRRILKTGYINVKALKSNFGPYTERLVFYAEEALMTLFKLRKKMGIGAPKILLEIIADQKKLLNLCLDLGATFKTIQ